MSLPAPRLDDRGFQDIVDEAKKRIPYYTKDWTDHNVSDPGVTLIELFAWMTEMILYRLNRVPDRHYVKFMELLGMKLQEPVAAQADLTFYLSTAAESLLAIPAGTEVGTKQTETEPSIIFTTDENLVITPPEWQHILKESFNQESKSVYAASNVVDIQRDDDSNTLAIFSDDANPGESLLFGFDNNISYHLLQFIFSKDGGRTTPEGTQVNPEFPPYVWEVAIREDGLTKWVPCDLENDTTEALFSAGVMRVHVPEAHRLDIDRRGAYWVRLRHLREDELTEEMGLYAISPKVASIQVNTLGGTARASHSQSICDETLGISDGAPGQAFQLNVFPILARQAETETLLVQMDNGGWQRWTEVADFASSTGNDHHFMLDSATGELRLGPATRQPDGSVRRFGAIPARNAVIRFSKYRFGGGHEGNVIARTLDQLKTSIPYVASVTNRRAASGGRDAESLENARLRAPAHIRARDRAVTPADFEYLAQQAAPDKISRVKCIHTVPTEDRVSPGDVHVILVPVITPPNAISYHRYVIGPDQLRMPSEVTELVREELDKRRMLTVRLNMRDADYRFVAVRVVCRAVSRAFEDNVGNAILTRLYRFLNPIEGGPDGTGWPFGRDLYEADVYQSLMGLDHVQFIQRVELFEVDSGTDDPDSKSATKTEFISLPNSTLIASAVHEIRFIND